MRNEKVDVAAKEMMNKGEQKIRTESEKNGTLDICQKSS